MRKLLFCCAVVCFCFGLFVRAEIGITMGVKQEGVYLPFECADLTLVSGDESVVTVNKDGLLKALKAGETAIEVTDKDGSVSSVPVTVLKAPSALSCEVKQLFIMQGTTAPLPAFSVGEGEYNGPLTVRLNNTSAVLTEDGLLYGNSIGAVTAFVQTYNGVLSTLTIYVKCAPGSIALSAESLRMGVGDEARLTYTLEPSYSFSRVAFASSDESVAAVDENGTVTASGYGVAEITAATENRLIGVCRVEVLPPPKYLIVPESVQACEGMTGVLSCALPEGSYSTVSFEALTPDLLSVDSNGRWTALSAGSGILRARAGEVYADTVFEILPLARSVFIESEKSTLYIGEETGCSLTFEPAGSFADVTWSSSYPACATVDQTGHITALGYGSTVITARAQTGLKASVTITVMKKPDRISLSESAVELNIGDEYALSCVFPSGTLDRVSFTSLNSSVAEADAETGLVKAIAPGTACVLCKTRGGLTATCLVSVKSASVPAEADFKVWFMDIDSNDGILLRSGSEYAFIDSGNHIYGEQAAEFLEEMGVTHLKYYIGTHAHLDHIGGACVLLSRFDIDMVIVPHAGVISAIQNSVWYDTEREAVRDAVYCILPHGKTIYLGGVPLRCLGPITYKKVAGTDNDENANSLVLRADAGNLSFLFTGDATYPELASIRALYGDLLKTDVFKNPHHSAEMRTEMLEFIHPSTVIFSTTSLRIPSYAYQAVFESLGCEIYITATRKNGNIRLYTDGETLTVTTQYEDNTLAWNAEHNVH